MKVIQRIWAWILGLFHKPGYVDSQGQATTATDGKWDIPNAPVATPKKISKREQRLIRRNAISHPLRSAHFGTFRPIGQVGRGANRQRVRFACSTRAFKDAFYKEYGVRLK